MIGLEMELKSGRMELKNKTLKEESYSKRHKKTPTK
jgi:hypothetical protein